MRAGQLDRRINIERTFSTLDEFGRDVPAWNTIAKVWAQVEFGAGTETRATMEVAAEQRRTFRIRWLSGLLSTDRIVYEGKSWDILDIAELGRRDGLLVTGIARVDKTAAPAP